MRSVGHQIARAREVVSEWLPDNARIESLSGGRDVGADLLIRVGRTTLIVEIKRLADPGWLSHAVDQVRAHAENLGKSAVPVVAVPFMGEVGKRVLRDAGVSWFDLSGNADITAPGLRIYVEGKR